MEQIRDFKPLDSNNPVVRMYVYVYVYMYVQTDSMSIHTEIITTCLLQGCFNQNFKCDECIRLLVH